MTLLGELADLWRKLEMGRIEIDKTDPITFTVHDCLISDQIPEGGSIFSCKFHGGFFKQVLHEKIRQTDCDQIMRRDAHPYLGKQYLRDDDKKEVHDLDNEKTGANQCQIDEIKNFTMFDSKDEALKGAGGHHCMLKDDTD